MRWHRYLSCFVAPAMIFFAISGAWQAFRLTRPAWRVWVLLGAGIALPALLAWATRR
jgi:hypothetical protein